MKPIAVAFCALLLGAAPAVAAPTDTDTFSQTVRLDPGGTLKVHSFSGRVTITPTDRNEVVVEAVRRGTADRLKHLKIEVRAEGSTVTIEANRKVDDSWIFRDNVVETDFDIKVPKRTNLDVKVFSAAVDVSGVEGHHTLNGFSSRIRAVDVDGSIKAHTFSGPVDIAARSWRDGQNIDVDTFSGNVSLKVPDGTDAAVTFNSFSGRLNSDRPLTLQSSSRRNLQARLGAATGNAGNLRFKTFSGSVRIQ